MKSSLTDAQVTKVGGMAIKTLVLILLAFVCILIGAMLQRGISGESVYLPGGSRGVISQADLVAAPAGQESAPLTTFSASVVSVSSDSMEVQLNSGRKIQVSLASDVMVVNQVPKDAAVYQVEQEDFLNSLPEPGEEASSTTDLPEPPSPFVEEAISLDSIEAGDNVILESEEDILTSGSVTIIKIAQIESPQITPELGNVEESSAE